MNFDQKMQSAKLYDIYYELFTDKQQQIFELYIDEDYSTSEIATKLNVSDANVSKTIKKVKEKLEFLEEKLKILTNYEHNIKLLKKEKVSVEILKKIK